MNGFIVYNLQQVAAGVELFAGVLCYSGAAEQELAEVTGGDGGSLSSLLQAMLEQLLLPHLKPLKDTDGGLDWRISIDVIVRKRG